MTTGPRRPPQVLSACLFIGASSGLLLFYVVQMLTSWNSIAVQDGIRDAFSEGGLTATGGLVEGIRIALQVVVVGLVTGVVCAIYAARGHRASRLVITGVAVLVGIGFLFAGGLFGLLPAAFCSYSVVQLWSAPSRRWFAGEPEPAVTTPTRPDPFAEQGAPVGRPADLPPPGGPPVQTYASQPVAPPPAPPAPRTATPVRTIVLIVTLAAGIPAVVCGIFLVVHTFAYDTLVASYRNNPMAESFGMTSDELIDSLHASAVMCAVVLALSLAAIGAVLALARRSRVGHLATTVLSGVTVVLGVFSLIGIPWAALAVWVLVLLRRPETLAWVRPSPPV